MTADEFQKATGAWPERMADLERFRVMLTEANEVMNLVGPDSLPDFWNRHAWDSAQLLDLAGFEDRLGGLQVGLAVVVVVHDDGGALDLEMLHGELRQHGRIDALRAVEGAERIA